MYSGGDAAPPGAGPGAGPGAAGAGPDAKKKGSDDVIDAEFTDSS